MTYTYQAPNGATVTATWRKDHFELVTYPAVGGMQLEWAFTLDYAVHRFNWLVAKYS